VPLLPRSAVRTDKDYRHCPGGAAETCEEFRTEVDQIVCTATPEPFMPIGAWYSEFSQTGDELLKRAGSYQADNCPCHADHQREVWNHGGVLGYEVQLNCSLVKTDLTVSRPVVSR
jgi:hypothetical protein